MKEYELWLILMDISNYEKVKLIEKYNNEENIYNNIDDWNSMKLNAITQASKYLPDVALEDLYYQIGISNEKYNIGISNLH